MITADLMKVFEYIQKVSCEVTKWEQGEVEAMICMIMENWCKDNGCDVVAMASEVNDAVKNVNEELGRY